MRAEIVFHIEDAGKFEAIIFVNRLNLLRMRYDDFFDNFQFYNRIDPRFLLVENFDGSFQFAIYRLDRVQFYVRG